jgi:hypothetical protein
MSVKRKVTVLVGVWMAGCIGFCSRAALLEEALPTVIREEEFHSLAVRFLIAAGSLSL